MALNLRIKDQTDDQVVKLYLEQDGEDVQLCFEVNGDEWYLITIHSDGTLSRYENVPDSVFQTDEDGRVILSEN
jgi:hypothetical protein